MNSWSLGSYGVGSTIAGECNARVIFSGAEDIWGAVAFPPSSRKGYSRALPSAHTPMCNPHILPLKT